MGLAVGDVSRACEGELAAFALVVVVVVVAVLLLEEFGLGGFVERCAGCYDGGEAAEGGAALLVVAWSWLDLEEGCYHARVWVG